MTKRAKPTITFPFGGIHETTSYADQPAGTCSDAQNVRPFDSLKARKRGGQRAGLELAFADAVNGSNPIQQIQSVALAFDSTALEVTSTAFSRVWSDTATYSAGNLEDQDPGIWLEYAGSGVFGSRAEGTNDRLVLSTGGGITGQQIFKTAIGVNNQGIALYDGPAITLGSKHVFNFSYELSGSPTCQTIHWRVSDSLTQFFTVRLAISGGNITTTIIKFDSGTTFPSPTTGSLTWTPTGATTDLYDYSLEVSGNTFTFKAEGTTLWTYVDSSFSANTKFAFGAYEAAGATGTWERCSVQLAETPASLRTVKLIVASGGNLYDGTPASGLSLIGSGGDVVSAGEVAIVEAFQQGFTADGLSSGYNVIDLKDRTVTPWQTLVTAGALPVGGTGTAYAITAVSTTASTFTVAENLSSLIAGDLIEVRDSTGNDRSYSVASDSGTGPTVITVNETIQDSTVDGNIYVATVGCRLAALYAGRVWLSGLETDPQNWWASRAQDPFDWDYFPATQTDTDPVAGNTNQTGKLEDIVTALMPYLDDIMYFGGDHTLWKLSGDPADSQGRFDNVSRQIGVMGPEAWTYDAAGNLYFMGQNGLYRVAQGGTQLEQVGAGKLDTTFSALNFASNRVRLLYDREWRGVHIFITPTTEPTTGSSSYFWDERTDSFWRDVYPATHGPTAVLLYDADAFDDRAVYLGGFDSKIRQFDRTVKDDDGTAITSFVLFTPIIAGDTGRISATDITVNLAEGSDSNAILQVFAAATAENAAATTTIRAAKTLTEGRNTPMNQRVADNVVQLKIIDSTLASTWALESGSVSLNLAGNVRNEESS